MANDRAKELARWQKEQRKAEKLRKKNSTDPADWGTIRQMREVYKHTKQTDPSLTWKLAVGFIVPFVALVVVGIFVRPIWMWVITGLALGFACAMLTFTRLVRKAAYTRFKGEPGSAEVAFSELNKKKWSIETGINITRNGDVLHRVVGRPGIILVGEGEPGRVKKMLESEQNRHEQVAYGVVVTTISMGEKPGQVPLEKLSRTIKRLPKKIDSAQIEQTNSRLKALDNLRGKLPIPKGPMPTKISRKAMRGR